MFSTSTNACFVFLQWDSCTSGKKEKTFRLSQQHSQLPDTHGHHQTRARYTHTGTQAQLHFQHYMMYTHSCFHRFDAGCRKLISGSKLSVHKVAGAPAEQMDYVIRLQWKRTVGAALILHTSAHRFMTEEWEMHWGQKCVFGI